MPSLILWPSAEDISTISCHFPVCSLGNHTESTRVDLGETSRVQRAENPTVAALHREIITDYLWFTPCRGHITGCLAALVRPPKLTRKPCRISFTTYARNRWSGWRRKLQSHSSQWRGVVISPSCGGRHTGVAGRRASSCSK